MTNDTWVQCPNDGTIQVEYIGYACPDCTAWLPAAYVKLLRTCDVYGCHSVALTVMEWDQDSDLPRRLLLCRRHEGHYGNIAGDHVTFRPYRGEDR